MGKLTTFEDLAKMPVGVKTELSEGVFAKRLQTEDGTVFFKMIIKEGKQIVDNIHDFDEEIVIYDGSITEMKTNTTLEDYERLKVPKGCTHTIYANADSIFYCQLQKPTG